MNRLRVICCTVATFCLLAGSSAFAVLIPTSTTANAPGVLIDGTTVSLYIPFASDDSLRFRSALKVIEAASGAAIPKTAVLKTGYVNSCAADPSTGIAVCSGDFGASYSIGGAKNIATGFKTGVIKRIHFTGGDCANCGVAIDDDFSGVPTAIISTSRGYLPVALSPFALGGFIGTNDDVVSGQFGYDPSNHRVLSPNYTILNLRTFASQNPDYQIVDMVSGTAYDLADKTDFFNNNGTCATKTGTTQRDALPDSGAYDVNTGIAYGTFRSPADCTGANTVTDLAMFDLGQASFDGPSKTWSDSGKRIQTLTEMTNLTNGLTGIAIPTGKSLAIVADRHERFGGSTGFGALSLPTSAGGTPALVDWVQATMPSDPLRRPWLMSNMPNGLTAYVSPNDGKGYGVILNRPRTFAAIVDIAGLLALPRSGAHTISSSTDLSSVIRFVDIRPNR